MISIRTKVFGNGRGDFEGLAFERNEAIPKDLFLSRIWKCFHKNIGVIKGEFYMVLAEIILLRAGSLRPCILLGGGFFFLLSPRLGWLISDKFQDIQDISLEHQDVSLQIPGLL